MPEIPRHITESNDAGEVLTGRALPPGYSTVNPFVAVLGPGGAPAFIRFTYVVLGARETLSQSRRAKVPTSCLDGGLAARSVDTSQLHPPRHRRSPGNSATTRNQELATHRLADRWSTGTGFVEGDAEVVAQLVVALVGEGDGAVAGAAGNPVLLVEPAQDGGAEPPAEVVALFAPVQAEPQQWSAGVGRGQRREVDTEDGKHVVGVGAELVGVLGQRC